MNCMKLIYYIQEKTRKMGYRILREPFIKASLRECGRHVHIAGNCDIKGNENIYIGNNSSIGRGSVLWTTRANITIGNKVFTGPNVTIITGNHRTNLVGKYMIDVKDEEKEECDDADVIIRDDVWIGANVTILKGVTIEEGCVIAAGAVVTNSTQPYGVYGGVPATRLKDRFTKEELSYHIELLRKTYS